MPFKSQKQRRKFYAMAERGEISKKEVAKWEKETPDNKKLPERVHKKKASLKEVLAADMKRKAREEKKNYIKTKLRGA